MRTARLLALVAALGTLAGWHLLALGLCLLGCYVLTGVEVARAVGVADERE